MHLTSIFSSFTHSSHSTAMNHEPTVDRNDPLDDANLLGTVCGVHGCRRLLDEAPVVPASRAEGELARAKRSLFPNSWRAIASIAPQQRGGWFSRGRRPKMIAVRYCEQCRAAAEKWMEEHGE